jgi:hypothetical protein
MHKAFAWLNGAAAHEHDDTKQCGSAERGACPKEAGAIGPVTRPLDAEREECSDDNAQ